MAVMQMIEDKTEAGHYPHTTENPSLPTPSEAVRTIASCLYNPPEMLADLQVPKRENTWSGFVLQLIAYEG
jgi:hypothetical protein